MLIMIIHDKKEGADQLRKITCELFMLKNSGYRLIRKYQYPICNQTLIYHNYFY